MIVICAGTSGYDTMMDVRYLWYMQKRYQGSHLFNDEQADGVQQTSSSTGRSRRRSATTYAYDQVGHVHQLMGDGKLPEGNVAVLINAPQAGLPDLPG